MNRKSLLAAAAVGLGVLATGVGLGTVRADGAPRGAAGVTLKKLKFTFETSNVHEAGTDADIYVAISYKTAEDAGASLFLLPTHRHDMEKGRTDSYSVMIPDGCKIDTMELDRIVAVTLINGMNGTRPGWHLASLDIKGYASDGHTYILATGPVGRWLDAANGEGPALGVSLKVPFPDLGAGDLVGETRAWKVMKPSTVAHGGEDHDMGG